MLQQLQKMINSQQNSEDQQGFIVAKGTAKLSEFDDIRDSKGKECKPFSPFYLPSGQGTMRLQLPESLEPIDQFLIDQQCQSEPLSPSKLPRPKGVTRNNSITASLEHPYRFYAQNSAFQLVYSKNSSQDPLANDFQYIRNEIILQTAEIKGKEQKDQIEFKKHEIINKLRNPYSRLLRSFQYPQSGQNQKNSSIRTSDNSTKANSDLLQFDSRFQSGNLYCAYNKVGTNEYHMFVQNDTNSYGYNQWFYFSLFNIKKDTEYTFVIVNFKKRHSFFRYGYKPIIFSNKKYQQNDNKNGWYRGGSNIQYQESHITTSKFFKFYKLSFTLKFQHQNDYTLIAANLPYSFSKLSNFIQTFAKQFKQSNEYDEIATLKIGSLGRTFCGNNVPEIKISPNIQQPRQSKSPAKKRKNKEKVNKMIIFMARQHPGQTVSSFLMQKVLNQLSDFGPEFKGQEQTPFYTQTRQRIRYILKNYTIIIFPMINIDGVIYGNSRCDVTGMDLNRRWKNPSKIFHPQICNMKNKIQHYAKKYEIVGCFDLHGHSKMYNVFCYSCKIDRVTCRILPYLISKQTNIFNFPSCTFGITRYKSTTARACMFKTIKNQNVLTIQSSYFGYTEQEQNNIRESKKKIVKYFQPKTFSHIAKGILEGLSIFLNKDAEKVYVEVQTQIKQNLTQILNYEKTQEENDAEGSGSETDPEGDEIDFQTKINSILGKQFLQQAQCFMPAEEQNIDVSALINPSKSSILQSELVKRLSTKQHQEIELDTQTIEEPKSSQIINKIRITKQRNQVLNKKNLSNQKFRSQLNFINTSSSKSSKPKQKPKKQTISYSFQRSLTSNKDSVLGDKQKQDNSNKRFSSTQHQRAANVTERLYSQHNNQRLMFGAKRSSQLRIHDEGLSEDTEKVHSPKVYDDLIIYSAQSKEMLNYQKSNLLQRPSNTSYPNFQEPQFFLKFQKFFPSHAGSTFNRKEKLSFLQESIYKDDQKQILNTLLQNKKRLQIQKLRRQKEKSTSIAERYNGNIKNHESIQQRQKTDNTLPLNGIVGRKKQQIVDFRRFKDRERLKIQLRQANQAFTKYIKRDGNY